MRNLKRALSLALAFVMVMSMMVVGAGAVSIDDFSDKDEIVNKEAVTTMVSLGVINGKDDGSYDPSGIVTRAEMAKLIAVTLNGGKDPTLGAITANFTDTKGHWAESYIAYVSSLGIIDGRGDGTFGPNDQVTGAQAAKMILTMLGYRSDIEGFTGANWAINVQTKGNDIDLFADMKINPDEGLTRDDTAQMLYNGVQSWMVEYRNLEGSYDGIVYPQPLNKTKEASTVLVEKFGVVKVEGVVVANDVFGLGYNAASEGKAQFRDTNTYRTDAGQQGNYNGVYPVDIPNEYVGQRVVIYVKFPNALAPNAVDSVVVGSPILSDKNTVVTTGDRMKDADAVKSFLRDNNLSISDKDSSVANDGSRYEGVKDLTKDTSAFAEGRVTREAVAVNDPAGRKVTFIDHTGDGTVDYVITENPTLAQVTVYNETDEELTIAGDGSISFKEIANPSDVAKGDMVLYVKYDDTYYLSKPETVTGTVTAFVNGTPTKVTMDGTNYTQSKNGLNATGTTLERLNADQELIGNSYVFYLDAYGNVIAKDLYEEEFGNYALVINSAAGDAAGTNLANSGEVKLMLNDGSTGVYKVNMLASAGKFGIGGTDDHKEAGMAALLVNGAMAGGIVTYVVDGSNVTIGKPDEINDRYHSVYGNAAEQVKRATASYDIVDSTGATTNVVVTDNTLFFVISRTGTGNRYSLIQGLSNVPVSQITGASVIAAAYQTRTVDNHTTNTAKAVVVNDVNDQFKGSREFVYIIGNYTQTQDQIKNNIYEYPAVFESGEKGSILVKNGTTATDEVNGGTATIKSGMIYEYRMNGDYAELFLTSSTLNGYVTSQVKGKSMEVRLGTNGSDANKKTHTLGTTVINVEDSDHVYVMDSEPTDAMSVAYGLNTDGYVSLIFVRDSDVHFRTVTNWTTSTLNINGANVPSKGTIQVANGFSITVKAENGANLANGTLVGWADYDSSSATDEYLKGTISNGSGSITMPANGDVKIGSVVGTQFDPTKDPSESATGTTDPSTGKVTLTLNGELVDAKVWSADGKTQLTATRTTAYGAAYELAKDTSVIVIDSDLSSGKIVFDSNGTRVGTVGSRNDLTIKVTENMTISETDAVATYAVTVGSDVTVKGFKDGSGKDLTAVATGEDNNGNTVYYFDQAKAPKTFNVYTTEASAVVLTKNAATPFGGTSGNETSIAVASTKGESNAKDLVLYSAVINSDVYLYAASAINFTASEYDTVPNVGGKNLTTGDYVKVGATVNMVLDAANGSAVITETATSTTDVADGYEVGDADATLKAAWTVTLNNVSIKVNADNTTYTNTVYVAAGTNLSSGYTIATAGTAGTAVLDTTSGKVFGYNAYAGAAVSADLTLSAAVKVTLKDTSALVAKLVNTGASGGLVDIAKQESGAAEFYILPGQTIEVTDPNVDGAIKITEDAGGTDVTEGVTIDGNRAGWLRYQVSTFDVSLDDAT
ncbi:S-layer homology domain-containing protein [Intestinimonas sp. HCP28S3_D6]|uniref:S-layer homology domain-containing protein n=1 Tax=Intestinimonas sp. HCP28S3_D6 TaxID=3438942 RepID=UPI003F8BCA28